ncbi:MAG: glycosyltransferase family 4 protein [bacterium]|nr:glycosyltransferase family 4 protein [bacterium]
MRLKLLFVITQGELGGAQRYVFDLATNLKDTRDVTVVIGSHHEPLKSRLEDADIKVIIANHLVRNIHPVSDLLAILELKKIFLNLKPDIIHLNSSKAGVIGSIAARLAGIKNVIFTAHGFAFLEPHNWFVQKFYFWAEKFAARFRSKIIAVSEFDRQRALERRLCPPEKVVTIHNGIDFENLRFALTHALRGRAQSELYKYEPPRKESKKYLNSIFHIPYSKILIGTIAHDYPSKDLATLRKAFALIKQDYPNSELVIIGRARPLTPERSDGGRGGTTGEIPDAAKLLPAFDIYVCSSVKEGFPYSILEAMAAGLPIVSTAVGGIPEMITPHLTSPTRLPDGQARGEENSTIPLPSWEGQGEGATGILVPPKNPAALAEAIKSLLQNPSLGNWLGQNAKLAAKKFSIPGMLNKTVNVYKSLINNR